MDRFNASRLSTEKNVLGTVLYVRCFDAIVFDPDSSFLTPQIIYSKYRITHSLVEGAQMGDYCPLQK